MEIPKERWFSTYTTKTEFRNVTYQIQVFWVHVKHVLQNGVICAWEVQPFDELADLVLRRHILSHCDGEQCSLVVSGAVDNWYLERGSSVTGSVIE